MEELKEEINEELIDDDINNNNNDNNIIESTNCLALTVVKEYKLTVIKNVFKKSCKLTWKIALSIITMNFLNTFL